MTFQHASGSTLTLTLLVIDPLSIMPSDLAADDWSVYYAYAALGVQAVVPIVTGSFASVRVSL